MNRAAALVLALALALSACAPTSSPGSAAATSTPATFADPFAYCAAVGNADTPGPPYSGPEKPDAVMQGLRKVLQIPDTEPPDQFARSTFWRCMGGKVYACNVGANIPCGEKADVQRTPAPALGEFCTANPNADVIPAGVTGRATIYEWRCVNGAPQVVKAVTTPDPRGYLALFWYEIPPP